MAVGHCPRLEGSALREKLDRGPKMPCTLHVSGIERFDRLVEAELGHASRQRGSRGSREAPPCTNMRRDARKNEYRIRETYLPATHDSMDTCGAGSRGP